MFFLQHFSKLIKILCSGASPSQIAGKVENIVSRQSVIGKPTIITLSGTRRDQVALDIKGTLDYQEGTGNQKTD